MRTIVDFIKIPKACDGSAKTQSAEEHSKPCCTKTIGLEASAFLFGLFLL